MQVVWALALLLLHGSSGRPLTEETDPIIAEGKTMGYIVERDGYVLERGSEDVCTTTIFNFDNWLSSYAFPTEGRRLLNNTPISKWNALNMLLEVTELHITKVREVYYKFTERVPKWNGTFNVTHPVIKFGELTNMSAQHNPTEAELSVTIAKTIVLRTELEHLSKRIIGELRLVLHTFNQKNLDTPVIEILGGEEFFRDLAQKVLGSQFTGGLVEELGSRMADLTRIDILGTVGERDLAIEVCMPNLHRSHGIPLYYIRPWGVMEEETGLYSWPRLPVTYGQDQWHHGIDSLLIADTILLSHNGITIVSELKEQVNQCRLFAPSKCRTNKRSLTKGNSTMVMKLKHRTLVVTIEEKAHCVYEEQKKEFTLAHHMFVREPEECLLLVGDREIGEKIISFITRPAPEIVYPNSSNDISTWEKRKEWTDFFFNYRIEFTITIAMIVIVLGFLVVLCCVCHVRGMANHAIATSGTTKDALREVQDALDV